MCLQKCYQMFMTFLNKFRTGVKMFFKFLILNIIKTKNQIIKKYITGKLKISSLAKIKEDCQKTT